MTSTLTDHPRLCFTADHLKRVKTPAIWAPLAAAERTVAELADACLQSTDIIYEHSHHNSLLIRARRMQTRVVTLGVRWRQTDDERYREALLEHVREIDRWDYWSWIAMRRGDAEPDAIFDLSYGENSMTLALAYDWLAATLSDEQHAWFVDVARRRPVRAFLKHNAPEPNGEKVGRAGWYRHPLSNWNTVCAGGAGMLALALGNRLDEGPAILARTEDSFSPFMQTIQDYHGGWPEGVGYWNYGMRYAFFYLLSHERATGAPHPWLETPGIRATLRFPLDFSPAGHAAGFGDANNWAPLPFHYLVAERLGAQDVIDMLDDYLDRNPEDVSKTDWPIAAELLLVHPRGKSTVVPADAEAGAASAPVLTRYDKLDWCVMADRLPRPRFYFSLRGGTIDAPHTHHDLMSFNCHVDGTPMLINTPGGEYLDTTFGPRRDELFEIGALSKNTLLINGVGITSKSSVDTQTFDLAAGRAVRFDGSEAMGTMRDGPAAKFCGRLFVLFDHQAAIILDRFVLPHPGRAEARFHTPADLKLQPGDARATLVRDGQQLHMSFACNMPALLDTAVTAPTMPGRSLNVVRWCTESRYTDITMATLISPAAPGTIALSGDADRLHASATVGGRTYAIETSSDLIPR